LLRVARDHLGIGQGPILAMLENHRSGLIWKTMRKNPHIRAASRSWASPAAGWIGDRPDLDRREARCWRVNRAPRQYQAPKRQPDG
jgi:hypothetical protein